MKFKAVLFVVLLFGLLAGFRLPAVADPLFQELTPLNIELELELRSLCREKDRSLCEDRPGLLSYQTGAGEWRAIPVQIRSRGLWRLHKMSCTFPPLFLLFEEADVAGTLFEGQFMLPMTTHCTNRELAFRKYVLKEYLAYRLYGLFSEKNVQARLVNVSYHDPSVGKRYKPRYAFFTEHFKSVALRNDSTVVEKPWVNIDQFDPLEMTTLALFQFMIGNTDWSSLACHNITLLQSANGALSPLPFDFDFSGLVNARYASPPPNLRIKNVRQRLYRGFCYPDMDWEMVYATFLGKQDQVFAAVEELAAFSKRAMLESKYYIRGFYDILESPRKRQEEIEGDCRPIDQ